MAKQSNAKATPTPEDVVAQNGGLEATTPAVEETAKNVEVVEEEVVQPEETAEVVETATPVVEEVIETSAAQVAPAVEETAEVVAEAAAPVVEEVAERTMECLGLKNHTCRIGGNVITISKDKVQTLTAGVATVLQRAGVVIVK